MPCSRNSSAREQFRKMKRKEEVFFSLAEFLFYNFREVSELRETLRQLFLFSFRFISMKRLLPLLLVIVLVSACKKECHHTTTPDLCADPQIGDGDCITEPEQLKTLLLGKWNWTQTLTWGWAENKANPCTKNLNYTYEFLNNGNVKVYVDGNYSATSKYDFVQSWTSEISITDTTMSTHPEIYNARGAVRLCGNYLVIDNSPVDGPKITFLREN